MEYVHNYIVYNGKIEKNFQPELHTNIIVYEVIRITEGIPIFLEKHLQRLYNSTKIINKEIPNSNSEFMNFVGELVESNEVKTGNIKISLEYDSKSEPEQFFIGFIPHKYPSSEEYKFGVKTISSQNLRENPNAKVQNSNLREELNKLIRAEEAYEAILVHPDGYITEGSRSNIFFIIGDKIVTSPDEKVLSGITRENVIEICRKNNYNLKLESLDYSKLSHVDAAFITGTSPKILPIKSIDNISLKLPNQIIDDLTEKYELLIREYLASHQII